MPKWWNDFLYYMSKHTMKTGRNIVFDPQNTESSFRSKEPPESIAQATYLLPRDLQRQKFLEVGYIDGTPRDYGLVKKAVGNNNFPVFQTKPDKITRDKLAVIGNTYHASAYFYPIPSEAELQHANSYPSAIYIDNDYNIYRKSWDLNNYGNSNNRAGTTYNGAWQLPAELLDLIGSPTVVTTGFQPVIQDKQQQTLFDLYNAGNDIAYKFIRDKGLVPYYEEVPISMEPEIEEIYKKYDMKPPTEEKLTMFTLPELTVTPKHKKK